MKKRGPKTTRPRAEIQSVRRALTLLRTFTREQPDWAVSELARAVGMDPSSVSRMLGTLETEGFIRVDAQTGRYRLGFSLLELAGVLLLDLDVRAVARPVMRDLARSAQETVNLAVLDGTEGVIVEQAVAGSVFRYVSWVGRRIPLHATSHGKLLLAFQPPERRVALIAAMADARGRFEQFTPETIATPEQLEAELAIVYAQGYATARAEHHALTAAVAAPILAHSGEIVASLAVPGQLMHYPPERVAKLIQLVRAAAGRISAELGWVATPGGASLSPAGGGARIDTSGRA